MIEVESLTRHYRTHRAVQDVSFSIGRGEVVGLLGHNGAGKTTIMRMLSGALEPSSGRIRVAGIDLEHDPRALQRQLGYLPEHLPVYPEMRVADYLDFAAATKAIPARQRAASVRSALDATELTDVALKPIDQLSRGFRQRVGVAQALLGAPGVLILDEPTNGLDPQQTLQMRALIRRLASNATVLLSTHILQEVDAVCDRVLILQRGRLVLDRALADMADHHSLELATTGGPPDLAARLSAVPGVASVSGGPIGDGETHTYCARLTAGADGDTVAAALTRAVLDAGASLRRLQPAAHQLDHLFRDAPSDGD